MYIYALYIFQAEDLMRLSRECVSRSHTHNLESKHPRTQKKKMKLVTGQGGARGFYIMCNM